MADQRVSSSIQISDPDTPGQIATVDDGGNLLVAMGSATTGAGHTLNYQVVNLTASGTVVTATASQKIKVFSETFTVQGGTVTITRMDGSAGGTVVGPQQFSPTSGLAWANSVETPLYETPAGSILYYTLAGSGTVGGVVGYIKEA